MSLSPDMRKIPGLSEFVMTERDAVDEQIAFVLDHPHMSLWLKDSLRSALDRDPGHVLNDLEILTHILRQHAHLTIESKLVGPGNAKRQPR